MKKMNFGITSLCYIFLIFKIFCVNTYAQNGYQSKNIETYAELFFLQPSGVPGIYGVVISGIQPYNPSWENKVVKMNYSPGFQVGLSHHFQNDAEKVNLKWMHLNASSTSKTEVPTSLETYPNGFQNYYTVAPPYDMGPGIFAIKSAIGSNSFVFDRVRLDIDGIVKTKSSILHGLLDLEFAVGIDFLRINQTLKSTFYNNVGFPATSLSVQSLPDPGFRFIDKASSKYWGIGPEFGLKFLYSKSRYIKILSESSFSLTCGQISSRDDFYGQSSLNPYTGYQSLRIPNSVALVPGVDTMIGLGLQFDKSQKYNILIQPGYRFAYYFNAVDMIRPSNLVYPGVNNGSQITTGNMNIRNEANQQNSFSLNGPFVSMTVKY